MTTVIINIYKRVSVFILHLNVQFLNYRLLKSILTEKINTRLLFVGELENDNYYICWQVTKRRG